MENLELFAEACREFFKIFEAPASLEEERVKQLYQALTRLHALIFTVQPVEPNEDLFEEKYKSMIERLDDEAVEDEEDDEYEKQKKEVLLDYDELRPTISAAFPSLGLYWEVLDPLNFEAVEETDNHGCGDAIDDLCDIFLELNEGYYHYKNGEPEEAAIHWRSSFEYHWGEHLAGLMRILHLLVYRPQNFDELDEDELEEE